MKLYPHNNIDSRCHCRRCLCLHKQQHSLAVACVPTSNHSPHNILTLFLLFMLTLSCTSQNPPAITIHETAENGNKLTPITPLTRPQDGAAQIALLPQEKHQTIIGFGGSFTQATAYLLQKLGQENRDKILEAYFGESGARYSLTRTHINSCDFSLYNYAYATTPDDTLLRHFTIDEDRKYLIPTIKQAQALSKDGFQIISTPWTAPPWMKDNQSWRGGKLLPHYYPTWALYFSKYLSAYQAEGIPIWGITVENEPLGNDSNWESMHFTPQEMNELVKNHLGPQLQADGHGAVKILGYDQNRDHELQEWVNAMYDDKQAAAFYSGTAIHWYASTYDYFADALQYAHQKAPDKHLIQTEACIDAQVPRWQNDAWYWAKEATDWGWDWAPPEKKYLHPKYVPVFRYAQDIIGCLNNHVDGWIDWNMVLDKQGGPNWAKNWCIAPVIADPDADEIYFTPLYYVMAHFSRYIRPGAVRIGWTITDKDLQVTAAQNPDKSMVLVLFNPTDTVKNVGLSLTSGKTMATWTVNPKAIQTIVLNQP